MMAALEFESRMYPDFTSRPKRLRHDSQRANAEAFSLGQKSLELQGVIRVLKNYNDYEGGINCSVCGKLYKSKVCFTKHLWEHTVYWDQFAGEKNHDRVLSIQAALILYSGNHGYTEEDANMLSFLLVTSPHNEKKQKDCSASEAKLHSKNERKQTSPLKRKRPSSETDEEDGY